MTPPRVVDPQSRVLGAVWLVLAGVFLGVTGWLFTSRLTSINESGVADYLFVARPFSHLAFWCLIACTLVAAIHAQASTYLFHVSRWRDAFSWTYVRPLSPVLLLLFPLVALGLLASPLRRLAPPWLYLFIDLRWWLLLGIAALVMHAYGSALRIHASFYPPAARKGSRGPLVGELLLALLLLVVTFASSPRYRFDPGVVGDEPKYLRYLENWYRGRGMDITGLGPIDELPVDDWPDLLGNFRKAGVALTLVAGDLAADARRVVGLEAPPPPGESFSDGGAFVEGRRGGVYQLHNPGVSLLLFPGYFVDRFLLNWTSPKGAQFPLELHGTQLMLVLLYVLWGVGLYRLIQSQTGFTGVSWLVAGIAMISLPASAFAHQYYPEAAGGLFFAFVVRYVVFSTDVRPGPALGYGFMAGYLPWLHVRFGSAAVLAGIAVLITRARVNVRTAILFWVGLAIPLTMLCLYSYHVTGSLMPFKAWTLLKDELPVFRAASFPRRLVGLWFDTDWGVVAHAPVYLLAIAGLWPLWQASRRAAILVPLFILSLAIPAAGHNWHGSGTTPLRLVAAVVPLVAVPLAAAVVYYRRSRLFLVLFIVLAVVSVQNGLSFNSFFDRRWPILFGPTFSGWLSRLALPNLNVGEPLKNPLLLAWSAIAVTLLVWPAFRRPATATRLRPSWTAATAIVLAGVATAASAVAAWTGDPFRLRFMHEASAMRDPLLGFHLAHRDSRVWSARHGWTPMERIFPNRDDVNVTVKLEARTAPVGTEVPVSLIAAGPNGANGWGTVNVDFGDGKPLAHTAFVGAAGLRHVYSERGEYDVSVTISMPSAPSIVRTDRVKILAGELIAPYSAEWIGGLPPDAMRRPISVTIDRVTIGESRIELHGSRTSSLWETARAEFWVWLIGHEGGNLRAHLYHARPEPDANGDARRGDTFTLAIAPDVRPDGPLASVMVGVSSVRGKPVDSRSGLFSFDWPAPPLTIGAPIVVTAAEAR